MGCIRGVFRGYTFDLLPLHAAGAEPRHNGAVVTEQGQHVRVTLYVVAVGQHRSGLLYFTPESREVLRAAISVSKSTSSAMVSKYSTVWL
jgi:hypothetical protein